MKFPGGLNIQGMMKQAQQMQEKMAREMDELRVDAVPPILQAPTQPSPDSRHDNRWHAVDCQECAP